MGKTRVSTLSGTEDKAKEPKKAQKDNAANNNSEDKKSSEKEEKVWSKPNFPKSKRHKENEKIVDNGQEYPLSNAVKLLKKFKNANFDETLELHVNTREQGVNGQVELPHGTGKKLNIKIADEKVIQEIEKGKIDFDILIAKPDMMPKLAKVARILGPRGLMPNPKAGTITDKPEDLIKKLEKGQVSFKTEGKAPIIHMVIGKKSFSESQIEENIKTAIKAIGTTKIKSMAVASSMSPAIKLDKSSFSTKN